MKRSYLAVRWDPRNCHPLCLACHKWETEHPLEGEDFWRSFLGDAVYDELKSSAKVCPPMRAEDVIARFFLEATKGTR